MLIACVYCGKGNIEGELFTPYEVCDLPDNSSFLVCTECEKLPAHQKRVSETECNLAAEASHQEYVASEFNDE